MPDTPRRPRPSTTLPACTAALIHATAAAPPAPPSIPLRVIALPPPKGRP